MKITLFGVLYSLFLYFNFDKVLKELFHRSFNMEFKKEELIEREIEIARLFIQNISLKQIAETTGLSKKLLIAHIKNMMQKLKANDMETLIKILKERF
jgi:DNA-binding CsgD family transcriptional regulator